MINRSKVGICSRCGDKDVPCRKRGKELLCIQKCCRNDDTKKQLARSKVRQLVQYQKVEGIVDDIQELTIDLDRTISRYIRLRDMEKDGKVRCYICDRKVPLLKAHAMHFINRSHLSTRFLLDNLRSGCYNCNVVEGGNLILFAKKLNEEKNGICEWLFEQSRIVTKPTRDELKQLLYDFQQKLRLVENSKLK